MPPRKDQVERQAWQWADATRPEDVTREHMLCAYILQPPHTRKTACKRNCRHQPLCISGLGEHEWLHGGDVTRLYTASEQGPDVRPAQVPAGLKNLGATCYVNSLLQLWFHNRKFRRAILRWEPASDPVERLNDSLMTSQYSPMTPIGHLQLIFGYMHGGLLRTVDPSPFILSLRLDTMYQQDAQEFSKLFSTLLEEGLSHQSRPEVSGAVQHLMRGQYEYVTRCNECLQESTCPSYFYELDLQIQGQKQLSDCLSEFLREESLTGANQYNCQTCQCKRDASRAIRLTELPPVLNFQLMRFVFDRETGLKKKLSSHLRFPELLDVSEFVRQPAGSATYRLQAVLLHKGPSAYSGHYTAHICDGETGAWFRFNDEEVEKIRSLKLTAEDDFEDSTKKVKQSRCPKGYHSSNQAYMLVYSRVAAAPAAAPAAEPAAEPELQLPDHIQTMVDALNTTVTDQVQRNEQAKNVSVEVYRCREREVREVYPRLPCSDVRQGVLLVPAAWLTAWLAGEAPGPVDAASLLCHHGRLSPWHAAKTKCLDPAAGSLLTCLYGGAGLDESALCRDCVQSRCRAIRARHQLEEDARTVTTLLKEELKPDGPAVWVGKTTLRIWKRLALQSLPQDCPPAAAGAGSDNSGPASPAVTATSTAATPATTTDIPDSPGITAISTSTSTSTSGTPSTSSSTSIATSATTSTSTASAIATTSTTSTTVTSASPVTPTAPATDSPALSRKRPASPVDDGAVSPKRSTRSRDADHDPAEDGGAERLGVPVRVDGGREDGQAAVRAETNGTAGADGAAPVTVASCAPAPVPGGGRPQPAGDAVEEGSPETDNPARRPAAPESSVAGREEKPPKSPSAAPPAACEQGVVDGAAAASNGASAATSDASAASDASLSVVRRPSAGRVNGHAGPDGDCAASGQVGTETEDTSAGEDDDDEEEEEFNGDLRCSHGELCVEEGARRLVPASVWSILAKYFPEAQEYRRDCQLCAQCMEQVSEEEQMRQLYRQMATEQRAALSDLYSDRLRPQVAAPACAPGRYWALGRQSTELWRKFLKDPLRRDPANLETRSLICRHGGLLFSPDLREDRDRMVFLYDWEWDIVKRSGHDGCEVVITRSDGDRGLCSQPEPCDECIQSRHAEEHQRQLQYASTKIFVRKVDNLEEELEEMASKRPRLDSGSEPVRRSSRPRRAPGAKPLNVASTDTLRDLKVQIMKAFKVAPYDQHLVFNGVPLVNGLATLGHLGVIPGSTLLLKVDEASDPADFTASEDLTAAANPEMGFKGTGLVSS